MEVASILYDYTDIARYICTPIIISVFAFVSPLLLQTATRIDEKYNSTWMVKIYFQDKSVRWFVFDMAINIFLMVLYALHLPRIIDVGQSLNPWLENSALILLFLVVLSLVGITAWVIYVIYIYYIPNKLFVRLRLCYDKCKQDGKPLYYKGIESLMHFSVNKKDKELAFDTLSFFTESFIAFRKGKEHKYVEYPKEFYEMVAETNEKVFLKGEELSSYFNEAQLTGFLLDEFQTTYISETTYSQLWFGIRQALFYNREDFLMAYWRKAHQLLSMFFNEPQPKYGKKYNVLNNDEIENFKVRKERFLEFHYAIGALLLFSHKYRLLKKMFSFSHSDPPRYALLPNTMYEVMARFMNVSQKGGYTGFVYYEKRYPFPDINGVKANELIMMWIKRYISVLFLRQYTLVNTTQMPTIPQKLNEIKSWKDELSVLKYILKEYLLVSNAEMLDALDMKQMLDINWFRKTGKVHPIVLIDNFEHKLDVGYDARRKSLPMDVEKKNQFISSSRRIIFDAYKPFLRICQPVLVAYNRTMNHVGKYNLADKRQFSYETDISFGNSLSFFAQSLSMELYVNLPLYLLNTHRTIYSIKEDLLFNVIDRLNLNDDYVIAMFNVNLGIYIYKDKKNFVDLGNNIWQYKNHRIIAFNCSYMDSDLADSVFIFKKEDRPQLVYNKVTNATMVLNHLEEIDYFKHTYYSLVDLNTEPNTSAVKIEAMRQSYDGDIGYYLAQFLTYNAEVRYKDTTNVMQLKLVRLYGMNTLSIDISSITNIWNGEN